MHFEFGPVVHIDEFPEDLATVIFGEPIVQKCYRKAFKKPGGRYEVTEVSRDTKTVTVTFTRG